MRTLQPAEAVPDHHPTLAAALRSRGALARLPVVAASVALALAVSLHLVLVGAGQWEADEYFDFAQLRALGWFYFWHRLVHWAPRPISETLLWGYSWIVDTTGRPLIGEFLGLLWLVLIGATLAHTRRANRAHVWPRLLLGIAVLAFFLLGHTVAEVFYWPMGAAAYLPTLAGMAYGVIAIVDGRLETAGGRAAIAVALTVAAGSSEVGAMFAAALIPSLLLLDRFGAMASGRRSLPAWWTLVPFAASLAVIALASLGRAGGNLALVPDSPTLHHFWPSATAALVDSGREFLALSPGRSSPAALISGAAARGLMLLGFRWCLRRGAFPPVPAAHLAALVIALLAAGFATLLAGYDLFGFRCCLRHDTMRECGNVLILLALAAAGLGRAPSRFFQRASWIGPAALVSAALLAFGGRGSELVAAYRQYPATIAAREATWRSAREPTSELAFSDQETLLTGQLIWPAGRFTRGREAPWYVTAVMDFFHKDAIRITPRSRSERARP